MKNNIPSQYIMTLIHKDAEGTITIDESRDLVEWIDEDEANWELFTKERRLHKSKLNGEAPGSPVGHH